MSTRFPAESDRDGVEARKQEKAEDRHAFTLTAKGSSADTTRHVPRPLDPHARSPRLTAGVRARRDELRHDGARR